MWGVRPGGQRIGTSLFQGVAYCHQFLWEEPDITGRETSQCQDMTRGEKTGSKIRQYTLSGWYLEGFPARGHAPQRHSSKSFLGTRLSNAK